MPFTPDSDLADEPIKRLELTPKRVSRGRFDDEETPGSWLHVASDPTAYAMHGLLKWLDDIGGLVGGVRGSVPGAAVGGAAGKTGQIVGDRLLGFRDTSLPDDIWDIMMAGRDQ